MKERLNLDWMETYCSFDSVGACGRVHCELCDTLLSTRFHPSIARRCQCLLNVGGPASLWWVATTWPCNLACY